MSNLLDVAQAQDYRIQYDSIVRVFLLPKTNVPQVGTRPDAGGLAGWRRAAPTALCCAEQAAEWAARRMVGRHAGHLLPLAPRFTPFCSTETVARNSPLCPLCPNTPCCAR